MAGLKLTSSPEGEFIAFSTQLGNVALDGEGRNSPFTAALLNNIEKPELEISSLMTSVRKEIYEATKKQLPWTNSALLGHFYFNAQKTVSGDNKALKQFQLESAEWGKIKDSNDPSSIREWQANALVDPSRGSAYTTNPNRDFMVSISTA